VYIVLACADPISRDSRPTLFQGSMRERMAPSTPALKMASLWESQPQYHEGVCG
jgi:hypothetical protein